MQQKQKNLVGVIISIVIIFSGISYYLVTIDSFVITEANFEKSSSLEIESGAQRLKFQLDDSQNRHLIYLTGERPISEPAGGEYGGTHVFKYAVVDNTNLQVENITDELVYPYHYDFIVDSQGQVHTSFITGNYTLYYAVRDIGGQWQYTQMNQPDQMFAMMPAITLGRDEQPRIAYSVIYMENGNVYYNQTGASIVLLQTVHYSVLNGSTWVDYDVGENHSPNSFSQVHFDRKQTFNPSLKIVDGTTYIVFTNKVSIAAESRLTYLKIPEFPTNDTDFTKQTHRRAIVSGSIRIYRTPNIHIIGEAIVLTFGSWNLGGVEVGYLSNSSILEDPIPTVAAAQWETLPLMDISKLNRQVDSVSSVEQNGTITVTWSLFDLFNAGDNIFSHDVFVASFTPNGAEIGKIDVSRVTDTNQIHHYAPSMVKTASNDLVILYITENEQGIDYRLESSLKSALGESFNNEGLGLVIGLSIVGIFMTISIIFIKLLPRAEEEIIILPHMINLKDEISQD